MVGISRKILQRELRNMKKHNNEKPLAQFATYNKNNPELFREIMKNLEELKNKDKIKEILDIANISKSQRQPKNIIAQSAGAVEYTDCTSAEG